MIFSQPNSRLQAIATVLAIGAGAVLKISRPDWLWVCVAIGLVWTAEAFNTAIEFLADELTREKRDGIKKTKDVAAFAVLTAAMTSLAIGVFVFVPYLFSGK